MYLCMILYILDLKQEKVHENLLQNVTVFDSTKLHHADTKERKVLPDTNSECCPICYVGYIYIILVMQIFTLIHMYMYNVCPLSIITCPVVHITMFTCDQEPLTNMHHHCFL